MGILQGTIPDDWTGDYCRYAVCWPKSPQWEAILRGCLNLPSRGRFWDEDTGNIIGAQNVLRPTFDQNLHLRGVIMACDDGGLVDLSAALAAIAASMRSNDGCCGEGDGSGGAPPNAPPFTPPVDSDPETDPPPDGFATWEEFWAAKCSIAFDIVEKLERDLGTLAIVEWGSAGAEAITASLLIILITPIPAAAIIALVFFLLTVTAVVVVASALSIVVENEEDFICALYRGVSSESSRNDFLVLFNSLADTAIADPIERFAAEQVISYMLSSVSTNRLYSLDGTITYPEKDCQACAEPCVDCIRRYDKDLNPMDYYACPRGWTEEDDQGGQGLFTVNFYASGPDHYKLRFRNLIGQTHESTPDFILERADDDVIYSGDDFDAFVQACEDNCILGGGPNVNWRIRSASQFTVEVKIEFCF